MTWEVSPAVLWMQPLPWTHSQSASVRGALEQSHVACVLAQHSAAGWCYPRGLGCGLGGFTVQYPVRRTQKCSVSFHKLYVKSKPRKCHIFFPEWAISRAAWEKSSVQARMSSETRPVVIRGKGSAGECSNNHVFKSHLCFILKFFNRLIFVVNCVSLD